ncbi:hypothetical protein AVEN_45283-1 [Araneus ventricosus]|uniref:Uncharacterized protein n=1 Tax=Araneus ventricosus TaxID=182803 RepID=A0A4Y2NVW4_ARAVE|nr:hypothetical protein AVEN_45283-1 [Araneus ventricosus]
MPVDTIRIYAENVIKSIYNIQIATGVLIKPAGVASPKLSRILISQKLSYSVSVLRTLARIKISNLLYYQNAASFSSTRKNNKANGKKIIRAGSEFVKREKNDQKGEKGAKREEKRARKESLSISLWS